MNSLKNVIKIRTLFLAVLLVAELCASVLYAQQHLPQHTDPQQGVMLFHPVLYSIEAEAESGRLSRDEALLQMFYYGFDRDRLEPRFQEISDQPVRCMVPVLGLYEQHLRDLSPATVREIEQFLFPEPSAARQEALSPSGRFLLRYELTGSHAVPAEDSNGNGIPDYIENAAFAADSSYRHMVENLGYPDFIRDQPYEISFRSFGFYGLTIPSGSSTRIEVHSTFNNFPENTHPEGNRTGALYATIAHELKHAIQYRANRWDMAKRFDWIEMDATMMEEVVFPDVNDYYNYIMRFDSDRGRWNQTSPHRLSIFGAPENPTPGAYWHVTWMLYFHEQFGGEFWVDVWDRIAVNHLNRSSGEPELPFADAIGEVLGTRNRELRIEHLTNHLWHMISGPGSGSALDIGFEDRDNYPDPVFAFSGQFLPDTPLLIEGRNLVSYGAAYHLVTSSTIALGQLGLRLSSGRPGMAAGLVGYFRDGRIQTEILFSDGSAEQVLQTTWPWQELFGVRIAVVNTDRNLSGEYEIVLEAVVPENDLIAQNYPNPFRDRTRIEFALNETKPVRLEVYDSIGRRVQTLVDEILLPGFHTVWFDGNGLASGIYHYRIVTDETVLAKKMVLIR
ncbi:MAG: T9SS C-terminal target domain-containing protein [Balneolaceae bacterium]|nr:MAG: T9SS C-terminal target domain-containing protein [Balneolaceae bacterium]